MSNETNTIYHSPLVSIITPVYNASQYIQETIVSILEQTYHNWELILINDCSSDNSIEIIEQYRQKDDRIKLLNNKKNIGAAQSRNKGIELSSGEYIAFLDGDDIWLANKLEKQLTLMQSKNIYLSYTAYSTIDIHSNNISLYNVPKQVTYQDMLKTSMIGTLTTIYNAKILGKFYFTDVGHEDYVMKLQILKQIPHAEGINEPLAKYRIHSQSLSSNKLQAALWQWHIYRKIEKIPLFKSIYYFLHYTFHGIFKYK